MFELHKSKVEGVEDIRGVVFQPDEHELRFYQFMFPIITRTVSDKDNRISHFEIQIDGKWEKICVGDLIYKDENGKLGVYTRPYWHSNWELEPEVYMSSFDCVEGIIFQDEEGEMYVATSRSTGWNVYETFFINEYQKLMKEWADKEEGYAGLYDELEKRTFTHIEHKPFLDLSTC